MGTDSNLDLIYLQLFPTIHARKPLHITISCMTMVHNVGFEHTHLTICKQRESLKRIKDYITMKRRVDDKP